MLTAPYLFFDGKCAEAFQFYKNIFGGEIVNMLTVADSPFKDKFPPEAQSSVLNARLVAGPSILMGGDNLMGPYEQPKGYMVALMFDTGEEAERVFAALAEGGQVTMPIGETFWSERFGMLDDKYGISWAINGAERV